MNETPVLMSAENPNGWKLEDLLRQLYRELEAKTAKVMHDQSLRASVVRQNNYSILTYLRHAEICQLDTIRELAEIAPDPGPNGQPRIG